ncbi:MAG: phosphate ABC transporter permease subunit PstC [Micrococcaceae bacterium]
MSAAAKTFRKGSTGKQADLIFSRAALGSGILILVILSGVSAFLIAQAIPALIADPSKIEGGHGFGVYILPLVIGTLISVVIALLFATPVAMGIALFISHYAPRKLSHALGYVIDLLAAIPSVVYGLWGWMILAPAIQPIFAWLSDHLGFIPIFAGPVSTTGRTMLTAGLVLSVMVLPIITSMTREIFLQTPKLHEEAALALGATKWEMIRTAVFPYGKAGIISAIMLGLGRALGETMAIAMVLSPGSLNSSLVQTGNQTIAAEIALNFPEASGVRMNTLIAAGLILFIITLAVNMFARWIVARSGEKH